MNDTQCQTMHTLEGHMDDVSCAMFHSRKDIIVSTSEDKSIRVWDATEKTSMWTFHREGNRFWILSVHPEMNLLAAGHDSGMIVFKSERERPAFIVSGDSVFYVKDQFLHSFEYSIQKDTQRMSIRQPGSNSLNQGPRTLSYSPTKNAVLVCSDVDGGSYELYIIPDGRARGQKEEKRGVGGSAVFVAQNRFAVLEKRSNQVLVKNMKNAIVSKSVLPIAAVAIFYAGTGNILCRAKHRVMIFGLQQSNVLGDCEAPFVRYVVWSPDMDSVALLSKKSIVITDKKLGHRFTILENTNVKSGAWDDNGIFIYTTLEHIMYHLPNGNRGIIQLLDVPAEFLNALYLGWVEACIIILFRAGQITLSMTMCKLYSLIDIPLDTTVQIWRRIPFSDENAYLLIPPCSFLCTANWPLKTIFERVLDGGHGDITGGGHEDYKEAADADLGEGRAGLDKEAADVDLGERRAGLDEDEQEKNEEGG